MKPIEIGDKIGMWTILEKSSVKKKSRGLHFLCKCDCGMERIVRKQCLIEGNSNSCGCKKYGPVKDKIFNNIKKNENGCWEWTGGLSARGYASMHYEGKRTPLHRLSYILFRGPIPNDKLACHTCDNKKCINPDHIYIGTHKTNFRDAKERNRLRTRRGSAHPSSKLNEDKVRFIRFHYQNGFDIREMSSFFGVTKSILYQTAKGQRWKHVI